MTYQDNLIRMLRALKPELTARFGVNALGVFGSVTRDDFSSETSDVDIIVNFSKPVGVEFIDLAEYLEKRMQRKVDLVSRNGIRKAYLKAIEPQIIYV